MMIIYILCGVIILQNIIHYFERRDLYNRLMSKNLSEYKGEKPVSVMTAHERILKRWREKGGEKR